MFTNFTNRTAISMTALTLLATSAFGKPMSQKTSWADTQTTL